MEQLLVSHWHKNTRYEIQSINGTEYIVPCEYGTVYDPIKSENEMMTDALNLGKYLTENDLGQNQMVLDFVHKYGLLGIMPDIAGSDIGKNERVIVRDNIFTESGIVEVNEFAKQFFPLDNINLLDKVNKKGKLRLNHRSPIYSTMFLRKYRYCEPLDWVKKYFKYLYSQAIRSLSAPASTAKSCSMRPIYAASSVPRAAEINITYTNQGQSIDALLFLFQNNLRRP